MLPQLVLYDRNHCDPVVLVQRLRVLNMVRDNFRKHGVSDTPMLDNAIILVEDLLAEHLPVLPAERLL